jgi:hypothetical protein
MTGEYPSARAASGQAAAELARNIKTLRLSKRLVIPGLP